MTILLSFLIITIVVVIYICTIFYKKSNEYQKKCEEYEKEIKDLRNTFSNFIEHSDDKQHESIFDRNDKPYQKENNESQQNTSVFDGSNESSYQKEEENASIFDGNNEKQNTSIFDENDESSYQKEEENASIFDGNNESHQEEQEYIFDENNEDAKSFLNENSSVDEEIFTPSTEEKKQCQARTKNGNQCKKMAKDNGIYCSFHVVTTSP